MGGGGPTRTPALSARYASEYNVGFQSVATFIERKQRVDAACVAIGRDRPMRYSLAIVVCAGATEADVARRAAAIGRTPEQLRNDGVAGSAQEAAQTIRSYIDAGCERIYLQILDVSDLDHVEFIANEVAPLLA